VPNRNIQAVLTLTELHVMRWLNKSRESNVNIATRSFCVGLPWYYKSDGPIK